MTHRTPAIALLAIAALTVGSVRADEIVLNGIATKGVRILAVKDGNVVFRSSAGQERQARLDSVQAIMLDRVPELAAGEAAAKKKEWARAAVQFERAYRKAGGDAWLKVWALRKNVIALDQAKQFDKAVTQYLKLAKMDFSGPTQKAQPRNAPNDKAARQKTAAAVEKAMGSLKPAARGQLKDFVAWLKAGGAAPQIGSGAGPAATGSSAVLKADNSAIGRMIKAKEYDKALPAIEQNLKAKNAQHSLLFYQRGQCQAGLKKNMDALVSYMRVIIHYPSNKALAQQSRVEAGKLFALQGRKDLAKNLWEEALRHEPTERTTRARQLKQLLESIGKSG